MGWYIVITEEMRALGLTGNDLFVFALINGFSQKGQGQFHGSISFICDSCGISRATAIRSLRKLTDDGFIKKSETFINGVKLVSYQTGINLIPPVSNCDEPGVKMTPNNKDIYINNSINIRESGFKKPSIEEIAAYCRERGNNIDAETFFDFYEARGWMIKNTKIKNWKACVRTWEKRHDDKPVVQQKPQKETIMSESLRMYDEMYGTDFHGSAYGKK